MLAAIEQRAAGRPFNPAIVADFLERVRLEMGRAPRPRRSYLRAVTDPGEARPGGF